MNLAFIAKVLFSAIIIAATTELAKRSIYWGALLIALPLNYILALVLIHLESTDPTFMTRYATSTLWLVIPSFTFVVALPLLLRAGFNLWISMAGAIAVMLLAHAIAMYIYKYLGISLSP